MKLLGPVFWYDLVRVARRQRLALWRAAYGLALLAALFLLYTSRLPHAWLGGTRIRPDEAAAFAGYFFAVFVILQFAAVILLTPALAANALAEEKGKNTLTFLLTTHLTSREIVLGKLFTRLLQVGLLVLTGLPVLSLMQFLGGVEPSLVWASFAALALTGLSLGSLGLACAVFVKKPQNAAWRAYQFLLLYTALSVFSIWYWQLPIGSKPVAWAGGGIFGPAGFNVRGRISRISQPSAFAEAAEVFNYANPYFAYRRLENQRVGQTLDEVLTEVLRDYAIGHGAFALLFTGLAVARLRAVSARQVAGLTHKKARVLKPAPHPPVGTRPVLWKEIYCEPKPRQRWLAMFFSRWFFWSAFAPAAFWLLPALRYAGTIVTFGLCLRVVLHAARSIGQERDRQTLDSMLTTDLTPGEIVRDKWWGSYLTGRWGLLWLASHWTLCALVLALSPLAVPLLVAESVVYAAFFVSLGTLCAAYCPTTKQAATAALVFGLFVTSLLPWAGGQVLMTVLPAELWVPQQQSLGSTRSGQPATPWPEQLALGLAPAWAMRESVIPDQSNILHWFGTDDCRFAEVWPFVLLGLAVYGIAAAVMARLAAARFRRLVSVARRPDARQGRAAPPALATAPS